MCKTAPREQHIQRTMNNLSIRTLNTHSSNFLVMHHGWLVGWQTGWLGGLAGPAGLLSLGWDDWISQKTEWLDRFWSAVRLAIMRFCSFASLAHFCCLEMCLQTTVVFLWHSFVCKPWCRFCFLLFQDVSYNYFPLFSCSVKACVSLWVFLSCVWNMCFPLFLQPIVNNYS